MTTNEDRLGRLTSKVAGLHFAKEALTEKQRETLAIAEELLTLLASRETIYDATIAKFAHTADKAKMERNKALAEVDRLQGVVAAVEGLVAQVDAEGLRETIAQVICNEIILAPGAPPALVTSLGFAVADAILPIVDQLLATERNKALADLARPRDAVAAYLAFWGGGLPPIWLDLLRKAAGSPMSFEDAQEYLRVALAAG